MRTAKLILVLCLILVLLGPVPAHGSPVATITVNTTVDEYGTNPGQCALREAIQAANDNSAFGGCPAGGASPVVELAAGTYALTLTGADEDANATGDLDLNAAVTINGAGQATTIIDASGLGDRVLHILGNTVALNDLTITGGRAPDGPDGADASTPGADGVDGDLGQSGGGIFNEGSLTLGDCTVSGNRAGAGGAGGAGQTGADGSTGGDEFGQDGGYGGVGGEGGLGGGIYNASGSTLTIDDSIISGNTAGQGGDGGASSSGGDGASSGSNPYGGDGGEGGDGGKGGSGGGIRNAEGATTTLQSSTISDNRAGDGGDGRPGGQSGSGGSGGDGGDGGEGGEGANGGEGGGVDNEGALSITECTILGNTSGSGGDGVVGGDAMPSGPGETNGLTGGSGGSARHGGRGGGIHHQGSLTLLVTKSTVIGNRTGGGGAGGDGGQGGISGTGRDSGDGGGGAYGGEGGEGGGIAATGSLSIEHSTIRENETGRGGDGGAGGSGGIGGQGASGAAGGAGGDGGNGASGGSGGNGGGIYASGDLSLDTCILDHNSVGSSGSGGVGGAGGTGGTGGSEPAGDGGGGGDGGDGGDGGNGGGGGGLYTSSSQIVSILSSTIHSNSAAHGGQNAPGGSGGAGGAPGAGSGAANPGANGDGGTGGGNRSGGDGGGLRTRGPVEIKDSTISANNAGNGSRGGDGGDAGPNPASTLGMGGRGDDGGPGGDGGGIYNTGPMTVTNVTISGNAAGQGAAGGDSGIGPEGQDQGGDGGDGGKGGGLYLHTGPGSSLNMAFATIADNRAQSLGGLGGNGSPPGSDGLGGQGGGVYNGLDMYLGRTILGDNAAAAGGPDCYGTLNSKDDNLVEDVADCTLVGSITDKTGLDPALAPLGNNGGPTETHLPLPASPALDGNGSKCYDAGGGVLLVDQRGRTRPVDGDHSSGPQCDIGAVEVQSYRHLVTHVTGTGQGNIQSAPPGVNCGDGGTVCLTTYDVNTTVTLDATPDSVSSFVTWSGGCNAATLSCTVTMDTSKEVTATFDLIPTHTLTVAVDGSGSGSVNSDPAGIACTGGSSDCVETYLRGTGVTLTAAADTGSRFVTWGGACSGSQLMCQVTVNADESVTATFGPATSVYLPIVLRDWP